MRDEESGKRRAESDEKALEALAELQTALTPGPSPKGRGGFGRSLFAFGIRRSVSWFRLSAFGFPLLFSLALLTPTVSVSAAPSLDPAVAKAQAERIATIAKAKDAVLAIFSPAGGGGGSGVVISPDGFALTNFHVAKPSGNAMKCGMSDGRLYDAVLVGLDPVGDVALVKLFGRNDFPLRPIRR